MQMEMELGCQSAKIYVKDLVETLKCNLAKGPEAFSHLQ